MAINLYERVGEMLSEIEQSHPDEFHRLERDEALIISQYEAGEETDLAFSVIEAFHADLSALLTRLGEQ